MKDKNMLLEIIKKECDRQISTLSLIASENLIYDEALELAKYPLSNKYSEGYPGKRFYAGCENIDALETFAIEEAKKAFKCSFANVQCYSGSIANFAIYKAFLDLGDRILSMEMSSGGHLTHSSSFSFVSDLYDVKTYSVNRDTLKIDYEELERIALLEKPKLIIAGSSSYPFKLDFKKFREIADKVGAYLFADVCHFSGFIISGLHESCFPHAHVAMCTTHKQLRGTRGAIILWNDEKFTQKINKSVFPGIQGGMNPSSLAMNAMALKKANEKDYVEYMKTVLRTSKDILTRFQELGVHVIGNDTETHMLLIDVKKTFNITGKEASDYLESAGIIVNKNLIPFDEQSPFVTSGIRIGTLSLSILNPTKEECFWIADQIFKILKFRDKSFILETRKKLNFWLVGKRNV